MKKRFFEDFRPGMTMRFGPRLVTREEILGFAAEFDSQPMHLDEEAGRQSLLGGLAGSGWHTASLMMRMLVDGLLAETCMLGMSEVEEMRWLSPLRPESRIAVALQVLDTTALEGRPAAGLVKIRCDVTDQFDTPVMGLTGALKIGRRAAAS